MPNRVIKESVKRSAEIDSLTWFEEVVFYRLIVTADDYGRYYGNSVILKNDLFPMKENVTRRSIEEALQKLEALHLIQIYTVQDKPYIELVTWSKHQRMRESVGKFPPPQSAADCGELPKLAEICRLNPNPNPNPNLKERDARAREGQEFVKPTEEDVANYCRERNNGIDPKRFVNYYTANGWRVGKGLMRDWKAAVRAWESVTLDKPATKETAESSFDADEFFRAALERTYCEGIT